MIYHLNCGTLRPSFPKIEALVYCLLVETNQGLILVDSGIGTRDYLQPSLMVKLFIKSMGVPRDLRETAVERVKALGFSPGDVKHIVLTHLHFDHAGGLPDFPDALVHVYRGEFEAMLHHQGLLSWGCEKMHFQHNPHWVHYDYKGEMWYDFPAISILDGLRPEFKLILLPGHTRGHCGVAIKTEIGWLLHCGDAASPFNKHSDVLDLPESVHRMSFIPKWLARWIIGPHVTALHSLRGKSSNKIAMISGHDIYSFQKNINPT